MIDGMARLARDASNGRVPLRGNQTMKRESDNSSDAKVELQTLFERSLDALRKSQESAKPGAQAESLRRRSLPLHMNPANFEKAALSDAAKALAALWISAGKRATP
jgi:hypothetical protein